MPKYIVKPGDSQARIAGLIWGNQRYFQLVPGNLQPGQELDLPDDPGPNPYISQDTWNAVQTGYSGGGQPTYNNSGPAMPNVGLPTVPEYKDPRTSQGPRYNPTAPGPAKPYVDPRSRQGPRYNAPSGVPAGAQKYGINPPPYKDPRYAQGPRYNGKPPAEVGRGHAGRRSTVLTPKVTPLGAGAGPVPPGTAPLASTFPGSPLLGTTSAPAPWMTSAGPDTPKSTGAKPAGPAPYAGGPGPQDMFRPLNNFEINTGAMYYGMAIQSAIESGDRSMLPPMIGDVYWQSLMPPEGFESMSDFLTQIGYRMDDTGQWRLYNPKVSQGYGGGVYASQTAPAVDNSDYGSDYGYGGGGGGFDYQPFQGVGRGGGGYGSPSGLVNWRIGG